MIVGIGMPVTSAERVLLSRLAEVGGRYTFRPDGTRRAAYAAFNRDVVTLLRSLESKGLLQIDKQRSRTIGLRGSGAYASVTADITHAGRRAAVL